MTDETDLLAGVADNQQDQPQDAAPDFQEGPPPTDKPYPDWVPAEFQAPEKRQELLDALGIKAERITTRPDFLPEKFWKEGEGVNVEALAKSYCELEKKLGQGRPKPPEKYDIKPPEGVDLGDSENLLSEADEALFRELGLDNDQAQKLTEYFWSSVVPMLAEQQGELELTKLANAWDIKIGEAGVRENPELKNRLAQVKQWAEANLPESVRSHLTRSASGVQAMWAMMQTKLSGLPSDSAPAPKDSTAVAAMINDDRYWDPGPIGDAYRRQVQAELERSRG